jgi:hypothetical protein
MLDISQPLLDPGQSRLLFLHPLPNLGLLQPQHTADLFRRQVVFEQLVDLIQRKPQILQGQDAVEPGQLAGRVVAVTGKVVYLRRLEQTDLVVVAQCLYCYLAEL